MHKLRKQKENTGKNKMKSKSKNEHIQKLINKNILGRGNFNAQTKTQNYIDM